MHVLIVGGSAARRITEARARVGARRSTALDAASLPFTLDSTSIARGATLLLPDIDRAFPNHQTGGARLVLTQSAYVIQKLVDLLGPDGSIVATADRDALQKGAGEAFQARGPWRFFEVVELPPADADAEFTTKDTEETKAGGADASRTTALLMRAYETDDPQERVASCREAVQRHPESAVAHLALASACRETLDWPGARAALDRAIELAPRWEAAHFEDGKFWLASDDMVRARDAFATAGALMPGFSAAFTNLGATHGELDDPERALAAFEQALAYDPNGFQALSNVGVASRESGQLERSEEAFRRVIAMAPDFVFGHYNLGHTLFLAGRYDEAIAAYEEGQRRDPAKNRRQGCRLAMSRFAAGDFDGASRDLWRFADEAPAPERVELLAEAHEIGEALLAALPHLSDGRGLIDRIGAEMGR